MIKFKAIDAMTLQPHRHVSLGIQTIATAKYEISRTSGCYLTVALWVNAQKSWPKLCLLLET
jgi:hypothetical protein